MYIRVLGDGRLRVELKSAELSKFGLDRSSVGSASVLSCRLIHEILAHARAAGFPSGGRMLMEVFARRPDGCVIFFTALGAGKTVAGSAEEKGCAQPQASCPGYILDCPDLEGVIAASERFALSRSAALRSSQLYLTSAGYSLVFCPVKGVLCAEKLEMLLAGLREYGEVRESSSAAVAALAEHGRLIMPLRAVENLLRYFS